MTTVKIERRESNTLCHLLMSVTPATLVFQAPIEAITVITVLVFFLRGEDDEILAYDDQLLLLKHIKLRCPSQNSEMWNFIHIPGV